MTTILGNNKHISKFDKKLRAFDDLFTMFKLCCSVSQVHNKQTEIMSLIMLLYTRIIDHATL